MNALEKLFSLEGKTAIVTGGAQGIGSVVAMRMAEVGANIAIFDMQEEKDRKRNYRGYRKEDGSLWRGCHGSGSSKGRDRAGGC